MGKRSLDVLAAAIGLVLLLPVFAAIAAIIPLTSQGPAIFSQVRLGRYGRPFRMYKFRSMVADASQRGARVTAGGDRRITPVGHILRRSKLDELPQLINVLKGDMSLVGPRPEVPEFADLFPDQYRRILHVRPGITHRTTLAFRSEELILSDARVDDVRGFYIDRVMPRKLAMYEECLSDPLLRDVWTILETMSPWKTTRAMTAGELIRGALNPSEMGLDAPIVSNVPAMPMPAMPMPTVPMPVIYGPHPHHAPAPVFAYVAAAANAGGDIMFSGTGDEVEELMRAVESAR